MTISHSVPSTLRKPGQFHEIDLLSGAQGLAALPSRILLIGERTAAGGGVVDTFVQIFDEVGADALAGVGSTLALMIRKALDTGRALGFQPEIFASPIADPAGTAATILLTVTPASAAAAADIVFRINGVTIRAGISSGDDQTATALAMKNAIDAVALTGVLPGTASVALGVVTFTLANTGVNGNDAVATIDDVGLSGHVITPTVGVPGVGVAVPTTALANSLSKYFDVKAISSHAVGDIALLDTHQDAAWAAAAKRWNHALVGSRDSLATFNTLSTTADDHRISVIGYEGCPQLAGQIAAAVACAIGARAQPNYNWDGEELPLPIPPEADVLSDTEIESALAAGSTPLAPNDARTTTEIVRLITTKTTEASAPFENAKDLSTIRGLVQTIRQVDARFATRFKAVNKSLQVLKRMRSEAYDVLKLLEERGVTQNVDILFPQLLVESDPLVATRAVLSLPESIIQNLHQTVFVHTLFVE